jgi:hypothetical protein
LRWNGWRAGRQTPGSAASLDVHHAQRGIPTRPSAGKQEQSEGARGGVAALLVRGIECTESTRSRGRRVSRHQSQPLRHRRERASGADVIGAPNRRSNILRTAGTKEEPPVRKTIFTSADWTLAAPRRESTQCSIAATSSSIEPSKQDRCATAFISIDPSES